MRITVFIVKFLLLGAFFIISNHNLALANTDDRQEFIDVFKSWVVGVGKNVASLTGYVVDVEWLPTEGNESLFNERAPS